MTSPTPLIQRLQSHQANARRMLTPGLKSRADQQRPFSPVLEGLGAQKYTQIAQNMRFLGKDRLGFIQPEAINLIGRNLPEKFTNLSGLLHIKAPATPDANIWSEVEQILPTGTQQTSPAAAQAPEEPGTLRQGSIIQRMQTFPKPGQSIEAFKEQVKSRAVSQKPASPTRKLPQAGDPAVRRYARIEEIRSKEAAANPEPPAAQPPVTTPPTVQRQQDTNLQTPDRPDADSGLHANDERQTPAQLAPLSEPSTPPEAQTPGQPAPVSKSLAPPQIRTPEPPAPALKSPAVPDAHTPAQPALSSEPRTTAQARASVPADKKPLARALPTARKKENAAPALPKGQPVSLKAATPAPAKASIAPPPRAVEVKPASAARATASTLQRQPDLPAAATLPSGLAGKPRPAAPAKFQPTPEQVDASAETPTSTKPDLPAAQPGPQPEETPFLAHLAQRRAAPEQVHSLATKTIKAKIAARPAMLRPNLFKLRRGETPAPTTSAPVPPTQPPPLSLASVQRQGSPTVAQQPELTAVPQRQSIEMPVARIQPAAPQSAFAPGGAQTLSALPTNTFQPVPPTPAKESAPPATQSQAKPPIPAPQASTRNIVQRMWEEHSPPASASGRGSGATNQEDSQGEPALDLDKLAEDVFPIVKRLIEIESERSAGYLR